MAKYANQITIKIGKRAERDEKHPYTSQSVEALKYMMNDLRGEAVKLWLYLSKNQDNFVFDLSQKACESWGIKKDSYYSAKEQLIEKGYLTENGDGIFVFEEYPRKGVEVQENELKNSIFDF